MDELKQRVELLLASRHVRYETRRMMGGLCYMIDGTLSLGVFQNDLLVRVAPSDLSTLSRRNGVEAMTLGGRTMKGYLKVTETGTETHGDLTFWIDHCLDLGPNDNSG